MGKYDKVFNSEDVSEEQLSPEEAVAAIAVVSTIADSSVAEADAELLSDILWGFEVFEDYSDEDLLEMLDRLIAIAEEEGVGVLFNTAYESLSDELILDAFAAGVSVLVDEEELTLREEKIPLVQSLQQALELEDEEAKEIVNEVIAAFQEAAEADEDEDETLIELDSGLEEYESPLGNFTLPIPVDPQQGGRIQEQEGVIGFSDDFGTLLRIDYYAIPPEQASEMESTGLEVFLKSILVDKYVPQAILTNLPEAQVKQSEYLDDIFEGSYFTLIDMPQGSTISKQENNGNASRLDAYRGILAFINGDFLYIVSSQRSFFDGETPGTVEEEAEGIKDSILNFVETIEFT
jgi:hypothetical protein